MKRGLELRFGQLTNQVTDASPNLPKLCLKLGMVGCTIEHHLSPLSKVMS